MSESVRAVVRRNPNPSPGDAFVTNDPAGGGSHLPDITIVTPVFVIGSKTPVFFVASRGHHADVGGCTPGSMPPDSTTLAEEGVVFRGERIVHDGRMDHALLRELLASGPFPARNPDENVADLEAKVAANRVGANLLAALVLERGRALVVAYMGRVQREAAARVRAAIGRLAPGSHAASDTMDDGTAIAVRITVSPGHLHIDFSGTSPQVATNLNAPRAVSVAAVLYVRRLLADAPIPLNGGCLEPVTLVIPRGSVLDPDPDRAVVAGNVETSQRVVDVLLAATGRMAASQGLRSHAFWFKTG